MSSTEQATSYHRPWLIPAMSLLFMVSFFNYMDRYMLAVLLPAIKSDLDLSDKQLGFITGFAFTIFYATMGIPIARLADRYSRKRIISIALGLWSAMTALCGFAQNFLQLAVARVLVGVGEAGCSPPSHSLIADYVPAKERGKVMSIYTLGAPIGILVGFTLGSYLAEHFSWRFALWIAGGPGLLLAILVWFRLYEPPRGQSGKLAQPAQETEAVPPFTETLLALARSPAFRHLSFATGLYTILWLGVVNWLPSFFVRSHELGQAEAGGKLALMLGISQIIGMLLGGYVSDRLGKRDVRWYAWVPALAIGISSPIFIITFTTANTTLALACVFLPFMIGVMQGPPTFALAQSLVGTRMRAMASAVLLLVTNLVGGSIGPFAVGAISDFYEPTLGADSLKQALMLVAVSAGLWSALHYYLAGRHVEHEFRHDD